MLSNLKLVIYFTPMLLIWAGYLYARAKRHRENVAILDENLKAGLTEPASLHPQIDTSRCIGCGSCVNVCPEQPEHHVLGVIGNKAHLVSPTDCIGHGACKTACPVDAIRLVFGTEKRGVDIPEVNTNFETNISGIFIAGELGGMGLIRNAIEQGRQAMESIHKLKDTRDKSQLDVVIVGAGPAGFAATLAAMKCGLNYFTVEQESLGGTVFQFPRGKLVMTAPVELPLVGKIKLREVSKEKLLQFWQEVEKKTEVKISYGERVLDISSTGQGFDVKTSQGTYQTRSVLLAIGRRGTPRKLGIPGEDAPKVVYRLIDPEQYRNQHVLVVGGGDSALEAATSIAAEPGTKVTLSYRSGAFSRAKEKNRLKVQQAEADGQLSVIMNSNLRRIEDKYVQIDKADQLIELQNDAVIINAGGILPTGFLKQIGINIETKYGTV